MITKREVVFAAFDELMISGITSEPTPEEISAAIRRMDNMVLAWKNEGLCLSYIRSTGYNQINPSQDSGLNDTSFLAVSLNLAKSLCPMFGKPCHPETMIQAKAAKDALYSTKLTMKDSNPYMPTGNGQSFAWGNYNRVNFQSDDTGFVANCSASNLKVGETDSFSFDFQPFLDEVPGETIVSYVADTGAMISNEGDTVSNGVVTVVCKGETSGAAKLKITITTEARVEPFAFDFNVITV